MPFPFYRQLNQLDCGPTCLRMIAKYYGKHYNIDRLRQYSGFNKEGVSLLGISEAAEKIGFKTRGVQINYEKLLQVNLPAIIHWRQNHFVVLISLTNKKAKIADPSKGVLSCDKEIFLKNWTSLNTKDTGPRGIVLLIQPSAEFYKFDGEKEGKLHWGIILNYLKQSKYQLFLVFISLLITSIFQFIFPLLTQSMVDYGIDTRNLQYITIVLIAQLMLTFSTSVVGFIRNRIQLTMANSVNLSILSDFWIKLTKLPLSYFDKHPTGDIMQRIEDNRQVQSFLTGQTLSTVFAIFNFLVYSIILAYYNLTLFLIFAAGGTLYFGWIRLFMKIRRKINYQTFRILAIENNATVQMAQGMQEIRLNNAERIKRWEWENIQVNAFKLNFKSLNFSQWQSTGALLINNSKDVLISFVVAKLVVDGRLTFGAMLAVQYIIGQLSGPINQLVGLAQNLQDTKISLERINEIHAIDDEEPPDQNLLYHLPADKSLKFKNMSFGYTGGSSDLILKKINLEICQGKVTAIVGESGSGKTTFLKILLKIYNNYDGNIKIGETNFKNISPSFWRKQCGAVLQDGFIFNDTIAANIAVGFDSIDYERLIHSCKIANILSFIESLTYGFSTRLGVDGVGISQGQKQRLLIARAVYKNPEYLFFDEATNSLDANNEKEIIEQFTSFFEGRTVLIVAHRLSTVKNADKIVVLKEGEIVEQGNHDQLLSLKGQYYKLVKNQLDINLTNER